MRRIFKKSITITVLIIVLLAGSVFLLAVLNSQNHFLAINQKVKANLLVVEGWLPDNALEMVRKEFVSNKYDLIITTGINTYELDYCMIASNGYLIFYPNLKSLPEIDNRHHTIAAFAHSKMNGKYQAHFNFFVNDSLIADFQADKKEKEYCINWEKSLKSIDSIMIEFDNDFVDDHGDRNLYVKEIIIDHKIKIPYQFHSVLNIGPLDGTESIPNNYDSNAELCRNKLISLGIDSNLVIAVPAKRVSINRTLTSALAFRNWLKSTEMRVTGINIISLGVHSRRTWIVYRKLLGKSYDIGIISLPEDENKKLQKPKILSAIYEVIGIIYYRIILNCIST